MKAARRRTLGTAVARDAGLCAAAGFVVFAAITLLVLYLDASEDGAATTGGGAPFEELIEHAAWAMLIAAPLATALVVASARWAAQRAMARVDAVIAVAARVSVESIDTRVPEGGDDDEIRLLACTLNALLARIESGIEAQRRFAADASHELRTPLAAMINALEVARGRERSAPAWERVADAALHEARRMADLLQALLHATRPAASAERAAEVALLAVLTPLLARWRQRFPQLDVQLDVDAGIALNADARALAIVFENLLANAAAHTPRGGTVRITAQAEGGRVCIAVEDPGPGVAEGERQRIFEAYTRGTRAADLEGAAPGLGLGLSIVRRIVEACGGRVYVDGSWRSGARFVLEFGAPPA